MVVYVPDAGECARLREAVERLVQLYEAWSQPDKAAEWKEKLAEVDQAAR